MTPPVIFLDVDGVLNPMSPDPAVSGFDDWATIMVPVDTAHGDVQVDLSQQQAGLLWTTAQKHGAEIVWLTTWKMDNLANTSIGSVFGWPELRVLQQVRPDWKTWWKSDSAEAFLETEQRPFVWIDDDLDWSVHRGDVLWLQDADLDHFLVSPSTDKGLTLDQITAIDAFLSELD